MAGTMTPFWINVSALLYAAGLIALDWYAYINRDRSNFWHSFYTERARQTEFLIVRPIKFVYKLFKRGG